MASYEFQDYTNIKHLAVYFLIWEAVILSLYLFFNIPDKLFWLLCLIAIIMLVIPIFIFKRKVEFEITIDREFFEIKWINQPLFTKKKNMKKNWSEIKEYVFVPLLGVEIFRLKFTNGDKFNLYQIDRDDYFYKKFQKELPDIIHSVNEDSDRKIKKGSTVISGVILSVSIFLTMIAIILAFSLFPIQEPLIAAYILVFIIGIGMFTIAGVILESFGGVFEDNKKSNNKMIKK